MELAIAVKKAPVTDFEAPVTDFLESASREFVSRLREHPFIQRCRNQTASREEMNRFLVQHGKYGAYFTRYLCALMSNLPSAAEVTRLAENLAEEIGFGDDGGVPHSQIYAEMLADFGLDPAEQESYPETEALSQTMLTLCRQPGGAAGLGALCLGAEAVVSEMYSDLVQGFIGCGVDSSRLGFFHLHIECDDAHAATMRDIIATMVEQDPTQRLIVLNAGQVALQARLRFFDGLSKRRIHA
jgi:pyrroloquinoline quinone (PQQ) biosynthesis protein C